MIKAMENVHVILHQFRDSRLLNPKIFILILEKCFDVKNIPNNYSFTVFMQTLEEIISTMDRKFDS